MAKIAFTKLALSRNNSTTILEWNNQKIEIKQYLPIEEKLDLISKILNLSTDNNFFYNSCRVNIFELIEIILAYTNINLTDKQSEDILKIYDLFVSSGFAKAVMDIIPKDEIEYIHQAVLEMIKEVYRYRDSVMGIMEQLQLDQKVSEESLNNIIDTLKNSEELHNLQEITTQLG